MHAVNKFFCSGLNEDNIEWCTAHIWLDEKGREIVNIPGDGLCFMCSMQHTLGVVFKEKYSIGSMITKIKEEVKKRPAFYQQFLLDATEPEDVIEELQTFFDTHFFSTDVVDLLVGIAVNIFPHNTGFSKKIRMVCSRRSNTALQMKKVRDVMSI